MYEDVLYLAFLAVVARLIYDAADPDDDSEEEISACIRCGSRDLNHSSQGYGIHNPQGAGPTHTTCNICGLTGPPVIFGSERDYLIFLDNLQKIPEDEPEKNDGAGEQRTEEPIESTP